MLIPFEKMQGAGNDYVLIDGRVEELDWGRLAVAICDRRFGVGSDGLLVISNSMEAPVRMAMYNPDGSEAEMCGNGIRCFAKYIAERGVVDGVSEKVDIETGIGVLTAVFTPSDTGIKEVRVSMGEPCFRPDQIPVITDKNDPILDLQISVEGTDMELSCVSMGNPHSILFTDIPVNSFPLERIGPVVERHGDFPNRTNFDIVNILSAKHFNMRVWERGVGETMACGTGACAAQAVALVQGLASTNVTVSLPGGELKVQWNGNGPSYLEGPAEYVFKGEWNIDGYT